VGSEGAHVLKILGQATIRTVVFGKGHMAVHGELWGQKRFSFRTPLVVPKIAQLHRVMALGHIEDGATERSFAKDRKNLTPHHPCAYAIRLPPAKLTLVTDKYHSLPRGIKMDSHKS
jgi:hypothetical protein